MKNLKVRLLALAVIATIGFAFATSPQSHLLNAYIPVKDAGGFTWIEITGSNPISNYSCVAGDIECTEYMGTTAPANNSYPSGFTNQGFIFIPNN